MTKRVLFFALFSEKQCRNIFVFWQWQKTSGQNISIMKQAEDKAREKKWILCMFALCGQPSLKKKRRGYFDPALQTYCIWILYRTKKASDKPFEDSTNSLLTSVFIVCGLSRSFHVTLSFFASLHVWALNGSVFLLLSG